MYKVYQVGINDTLNSIADTFGLSVDELISINGMITNIKYGDFIVVPNSKSNFINYTIEKGDTLYGIASKFNTSVDSILNLNGLTKDEYIYPGEVILIPKENIDTYVVKEGDTLNMIVKKSNLDDILSNNKLYLLPNQLIVYTKE